MQAALLTVLSTLNDTEKGMLRHKGDLQRRQLKAKHKHHWNASEHDSGCAKENVTRLNQSPYNTVAPRCGMR